MPARIIYTPGEKVGSSGVIFLYDIESNPKHRKACFQCPYCKKEFVACIEHVKSNRTKSCGCLRKQQNKINGAKAIKNLTNQRFGKLIAIEATNQRNRGQVVWKCLCDCGNIFYAPSAELIRGKVQSCGCLSMSAGELKIQQILDDLQLSYEQEFLLPNRQRFDFYLFKYNIAIEYDGEQHFKSSSGWNTKEHLEYVKKQDEIKNKYCKDNNIKLIRIPYTDYKILNKEYLLDKIKES